ncbi:MAG: glycosyltransferase family 2 protein [Alphaproteobacteria bacterium]|nr:glycosyltransferase family 2 protein [Alphaproteobacteria bacterium]
MSTSISVIIPCFNSDPLRLMAAVDSVLAQPGKPELLLIDDASNSYGAEDFLQYLGNSSNQIRVHRHNTNKGTAAARNTGISLAQGKYICFLDHDDMLGANQEIEEIGKLEHLHFSEMLDNHMSHSPDIIACSRILVKDEEVAQKKYWQITDNYKADQCIAYMYEHKYINGFLFKKDFLTGHNLKFMPGTEPIEDMLFGSLCGYFTKNIRYSENSFYIYNKLNDSQEHSLSFELRAKSRQKFWSLLAAILAIIQLRKKDFANIRETAYFILDRVIQHNMDVIKQFSQDYELREKLSLQDYDIYPQDFSNHVLSPKIHRNFNDWAGLYQMAQANLNKYMHNNQKPYQ